MNTFKRKSLRMMAGGAAVAVLPRAGAPVRAAPAVPSLPARVDAGFPGAPIPDAQVQRAAEWIRGLRARGQLILFYPVSRLQREFRLGYAHTCALVEMLARRGEWAIGFSTDGTRYARIHDGEHA